MGSVHLLRMTPPLRSPRSARTPNVATRPLASSCSGPPCPKATLGGGRRVWGLGGNKRWGRDAGLWLGPGGNAPLQPAPFGIVVPPEPPTLSPGVVPKPPGKSGCCGSPPPRRVRTCANKGWEAPPVRPSPSPDSPELGRASRLGTRARGPHSSPSSTARLKRPLITPGPRALTESWRSAREGREQREGRREGRKGGGAEGGGKKERRGGRIEGGAEGG